MMSFQTLYTSSVQITSIILSVLLIITTLITTSAAPNHRRYLTFLFVVNVLMFSSDILLRFYSSKLLAPGSFIFIYYMCSFLMAAFLTSYVITVVNPPEKAAQFWQKTAWSICLIVIIGLIILLVLSSFFSFSLSDTFVSNILNPFAESYRAFILVFNLILLIINRKHARQTDINIFYVFFSFSFTATVADFIFPNYEIYNLTTTILLILLFLRLQRILALQFIEKEQQLSESRTRLMLSQIRPHFIFNTLTSIMYLCKTDSEKAYKSLSDFAEYLRGNVMLLTELEPVHFQTEINHITHYLNLEQLRFGDKLKVNWDIRFTDFLIPQLSVQPLMENAVKHGVGMKKNGGTVGISSYETENEIVITVSDDGVGFDSNMVSQSEGMGIGIENVRTRLSEVGGRLEISTNPGKGTVAKIFLDKNKSCPTQI